MVFKRTGKRARGFGIIRYLGEDGVFF